jgi:hypothetical protein
MEKIKLSEWAKSNGKTYKQAWELVDSGEFPAKIEKNKAGSIFVLQESKASKTTAKVNDIAISVPKFAEAEESVASVRRNRAGTSEQTNEYYHIDKDGGPYGKSRNGSNDGLDISEKIRLTQQCYFNFSDFRNIIDVLTEFTANDIHWRGGNKKSRDFMKAFWNRLGLFSIQDKFYREYYRSGNDIICRLETILKEDDIDILNKAYGAAAGKKVKLPTKYIIINPANVICGGNISFAESKFYQKLNNYEVQRLIKPITPEDKAFLESLPEETKKLFKGKKANSNLDVQIPLDPANCYFIFYKKQDYEPMAVPMGWPVLKDINAKAEMKAIDLAVARTTERSILLITMGFENKAGELFIDTKAMEAMRTLFTSESVKKTLVADFTTKGEWLIPEVDKILGKAKYEQLNEDIRTGLNNVLAGGDEKFANQSIKVKLFIQRLKQSRGVFLNEFLIPEVKRIAKEMGFKSYPTPVYEDLDWKDSDLWNRVVVQLVGLGYLTPWEAHDAIETGVLPEKDVSLENQREFKKVKDEGLYQTPQANPATQLEVLSETNKQAMKTMEKQHEFDSKEKHKDRKHAAENPQAPAPQIVLNAPTKMGQPKGRPGGTKGSPKKQTKPSKPSKAGISQSLVRTNLILASDLNKQLEQKLLKKFNLEKLDESQSQLKDVLQESIMLSEPASNWTNEAVIEDYISNPDKKNEERFNYCLEIGANHEVNDYLSSIIANSQIPVEDEQIEEELQETES